MDESENAPLKEVSNGRLTTKFKNGLKLIVTYNWNITRMFNCYEKCGSIFTPVKIAVFINIMLLVLTITSVVYSWIDTYKGDGKLSFRYSYFPRLLHIVCLCAICLVITIITFKIFFKNNFTSIFSTLGFLFYILLELILGVNVLTMKNEHKVRFIMFIECALVFGLLFFYTHCVSRHNTYCEEERRRQNEEYVNRQISSVVSSGGRCIRIPLKVGDNFKRPPINTTWPKAGPSSGRL